MNYKASRHSAVISFIDAACVTVIRSITNSYGGSKDRKGSRIRDRACDNSGLARSAPRLVEESWSIAA